MAKANIAQAIRAYIESKPWTIAGESGALVFGIEKNGETSYVVVTGPERGYTLALCPDVQALAGYGALLSAYKAGEDEMSIISRKLDQNYLECSIAEPDDEDMNRWLKVFGVIAQPREKGMPVVRKHVPGMLPMGVSDADIAALTEALLAAAGFARSEEKLAEKVNAKTDMGGGKLFCACMKEDGSCEWQLRDFASATKLQYPAPALEDELAARRMRRMPVSGAEVRCAVRRLPMPLDDEAKRVPTVLLVMDSMQGLVCAPIVGDYEEEYHDFASAYLEYVEENGRPVRILAEDPRTFSLLSELAAQLSTPIQRVGTMPEMDEAMRGMLEMMKSAVREEREEDSADVYDDDEFDMLLEPGERTTDEPGKGGCLLCDFTGSCEEMGTYLKEAFDKAPAGEEYQEDYLLRLTCPGEPDFWIYAAVKKDASLRHLDQFIRDVWVECCGHLSLFKADGDIYSSNCRQMSGRSMNAKIRDVLEKTDRIEYVYDMGTPTELLAEVVGEIELPPRRTKMALLAENFMPKYKCIRCGRRADFVFRPGMEPVAKAVYCEKCVMEDEELADCMLPLINSPRTGVCGYGMWFGDDEE